MADLRLSWARVSDIGARASNQDALGESIHGNVACFVVADGAGGHAGGEQAARLVVDAVLAQFAAQPVCTANSLLALGGCASAAVARGRAADPDLGDMSATLATVLIDSGRAQVQWAHLGDTRIYLFRGQCVHAVTRDHSVTQQFVDAGLARADQLRLHPRRNILYAAIGAEGDTPLALSEELALLAGDALLLCTDGLWEWIMEDDMERLLAENKGCQAWLEAMCALAEGNHARSGKERDNYSAYAIRAVEAPR